MAATLTSGFWTNWLPSSSKTISTSKSLAAAYLCKWINNIVIYNTIYKRVKPLMDMA
jgi:dynein heavy chain